MASFEFRKHLLGAKNLVTLPFTIANSQTIYKGGMVKLDTDGYIIPATAGSVILGVVMAIETQDGIDLANANSSDYDGTFTPRNGATTAHYAASADNESDKKVRVRVAVDPYALYKNDADGDLEAGDVGEFGNLVSSTQVDASDVGATLYGQVQCLGLDPDGEGDASIGLFRIAESQLNCYAQQSA